MPIPILIEMLCQPSVALVADHHYIRLLSKSFAQARAKMAALQQNCLVNQNSSAHNKLHKSYKMTF